MVMRTRVLLQQKIPDKLINNGEIPTHLGHETQINSPVIVVRVFQEDRNAFIEEFLHCLFAKFQLKFQVLALLVNVEPAIYTQEAQTLYQMQTKVSKIPKIKAWNKTKRK